MKTMRLLAAIAAALMITSCSDKEVDNTIPASKTVKVKISNITKTSKASKEQVTNGYQTTVHDARVFFLDAADKVVKGGGTMSEAEAASSKTFTKVSGTAEKVYIVANITYNTTASLIDFSSIVEGTSTKTDLDNLIAVGDGTLDPIAYQMDASNTGVDNTTLSGVSTDPFVKTAENAYTANVSITPVVMRIEIGKISSTATGSDIKTFDLKGVYINNYYPSFTLGGSTAGTLFGTPQTSADLANVINCMKDTGLSMNGLNSYDMGLNQAWAYMLPVPTTDIPRIILHVNNVVLTSSGLPMVPANQYLTVKGFKLQGTSTNVTLKRGEVYRIEELKFSDDNLTTEPNTNNIGVTVFVTVVGWNLVTVDPIV